jgi:hypothetical protein
MHDYDRWKTTEPELDDEPRCDCTEPCDCAKPVGTRERRLKLWREYEVVHEPPCPDDDGPTDVSF